MTLSYVLRRSNNADSLQRSNMFQNNCNGGAVPPITDCATFGSA